MRLTGSRAGAGSGAHPVGPGPTRGHGRIRILAAAASLSVTVGLLSAGAGSASAATVTLIHPGANVLAALQSLRAGDTLELAPGTYTTGFIRAVGMAGGTPGAPITITAQNPAQPPVLVGGLWLYNPTYIALRHLRIQATAAAAPALTVQGGVGWTVDSSEFWGALATNAYANVVISGTGGYPRGFTFTQNCLHDAAQSSRTATTDHNLYVNFQGSTLTGGLIARNTMWNAPHGENIKLGDGGVDGALGPWNVRVANNTLVLGGRQILLHANVRNNTVIGNLFYDATAPFVSNPQTTQVYIHDVIGPGNSFSDNYWSTSTMFMYNPLNAVTVGAGNIAGPNPAFAAPNSCAGWRQTAPAALPYGRWGTSSYTPPSVPLPEHRTGAFWQ